MLVICGEKGHKTCWSYPKYLHRASSVNDDFCGIFAANLCSSANDGELMSTLELIPNEAGSWTLSCAQQNPSTFLLLQNVRSMLVAPPYHLSGNPSDTIFLTPNICHVSRCLHTTRMRTPRDFSSFCGWVESSHKKKEGHSINTHHTHHTNDYW